MTAVIKSFVCMTPRNISYSSLQYTCLQRQTPSPSGGPPSSPVFYREAERSVVAWLTHAVSSSAGLSAACVQVQKASAHDPKGDNQKLPFTINISCLRRYKYNSVKNILQKSFDFTINPLLTDELGFGQERFHLFRHLFGCDSVY